MTRKAARVTTNFEPVKTGDQVADQLYRLLNKIQTRLQKDMKIRINAAFPPASKPLTPPHKRTGNLGRSITTTRVRGSKKRKVGMVKIDAPYARSLEFGADLPGGQPYFYHAKEGRIVYVKKSKAALKRYKVTKPGKLEPRPFVEPSVRSIKREIPRHVTDFFGKVRMLIRASSSRRTLA